MVDNPDIYYRLIAWVKEVGPKSTTPAAQSGQYDNEYPIFAQQTRDFRKELGGPLESAAFFSNKVEELPATEQEIPEEEFEKQRKDLLTRGIII